MTDKHEQRLLEVRGLCVDYATGARPLRAVEGVDLDLASGRTLGIAGASGSGKSTVALALLGLLDRRTSRATGTIRLDGQALPSIDPGTGPGRRGRRIGAIFQSPQGSFNPMMTIGQHLEESIRHHFATSRRDARQRARQALDRVKTPRAAEVQRSYAFELSGGMCQRAAIALALAQEPALLIADEPTSSLDVLAQVDICALLRTLNAETGLSMIVISHDLGLIGQLAHDVAIMTGGRVVESGPVTDVFAAPRHAYTRRLLDAARHAGLEPATQAPA